MESTHRYFQPKAANGSTETDLLTRKSLFMDSNEVSGLQLPHYIKVIHSKIVALDRGNQIVTLNGYKRFESDKLAQKCILDNCFQDFVMDTTFFASFSERSLQTILFVDDCI
jgi:hypothetical protein